MSRWRWSLVPAILLVAGVYLLRVAFASDARVALVGGIALPARFVFLLGGLSVLGGIVVTVERIVHRGQDGG